MRVRLAILVVKTLTAKDAKNLLNRTSINDLIEESLAGHRHLAAHFFLRTLCVLCGSTLLSNVVGRQQGLVAVLFAADQFDTLSRRETISQVAFQDKNSRLIGAVGQNYH